MKKSNFNSYKKRMEKANPHPPKSDEQRSYEELQKKNDVVAHLAFKEFAKEIAELGYRVSSVIGHVDQNRQDIVGSMLVIERIPFAESKVKEIIDAAGTTGKIMDPETGEEKKADDFEPEPMDQVKEVLEAEREAEGAPDAPVLPPAPSQASSEPQEGTLSTSEAPAAS